MCFYYRRRNMNNDFEKASMLQIFFRKTEADGEFIEIKFKNIVKLAVNFNAAKDKARLIL